MILNHFVKSIKKQDWFVVIIELIIVVAGVYIGIYLGDVAKQKEIDESVNQSLSILARQLGEEIKSLDHVMKVQRKELVGFEAAIEILSQDKIDINKFKAVNRTILHRTNETFYPDTSVFKTMQSQGLVGEIKDIELQIKITNLFEKIYIRHEINSKNLDNVFFTFENSMMNMYWDRINHDFVNDKPETVIIFGNGISTVIGEKQHYLRLLKETVLPEIQIVLDSLNNYSSQN